MILCVLTLVIDDHTGSLIVRTLEEASKVGGTPFKFNEEWYMTPTTTNETTQFTTIVNIGEERTVYSEVTSWIARSYQKHYYKLREIILPTDVSAVVIGHVYADSTALGEITKNVINMFSGSVPIIANFGSSQYKLGKDTWSNSLSEISYFQLDLYEMRQFFKDENAKLKEILKWFRDRCTVVITLDRKGAIAQIRGSNEVTFVWPYELGDKFVDTTGAGDAFAAAVTRELSMRAISELSTETWRDVLRGGALSAAYSCCNRGGTSNCPSIHELERFKEELQSQPDQIVDSLDANVSEKILRFVDRLQ